MECLPLRTAGGRGLATGFRAMREGGDQVPRNSPKYKRRRLFDMYLKLKYNIFSHSNLRFK